MLLCHGRKCLVVLEFFLTLHACAIKREDTLREVFAAVKAFQPANYERRTYVLTVSAIG